MKKICAFFLTAVLSLSFCVPFTYAAETPTLTISSGKAEAGEHVTLSVSIQNNPGLSSALVFFYYDTSVFTVDPSRGITADGTFRSTGGVMGNTIALARQNGRYTGDAGKDGVLALWYNSKGINTTGDGSMFAADFQVNANAPDGNYTIDLGYAPDSTLNQDGDRVAVQTSSGAITVTGGTTGPSAEPPGTPDTPEPPETQPPSNPPAQPQKPDVPDVPNSPDNTPPSTSTGGSSPGSSGTSGGQGGGRKPVTVEKPDIPEIRFNDVTGHWAETFILQAAEQGLVEGYNGSYHPDDTMRRAEFAAILWRAMGSTKPSKAASFTDLTQDWYLDAVAWAEENGVFNGVGRGLFDPDGSVTREQLAAVLHRLAGSATGMEGAFFDSYDQTFTDSANVSKWARASLYWAVYHEIYCGENSVSPEHTLAPTAAANRAQIAVMMVRYMQKYS